MISFLIIILPLQSTVNSARVLLSYVFIPQLRAAHGITEYLSGISGTVSSLLEVADDNVALKDEMAELKIRTAQFEVLEKENNRLTEALKVSRQNRWKGTWAKVAYREPSRRSTIIADKGSSDGIELRAPVVAVENGVVGLVGKVIEVTSSTSKILLSSDEDFSATAFLSESGIEGLASGNGAGGLNIKYIPLGTEVKLGEKVFTSVASAIFPDGILIGEISSAGKENETSSSTFLMPLVKPSADPGKIKEVLIMAAMSDPVPVTKGRKK